MFGKRIRAAYRISVLVVMPACIALAAVNAFGGYTAVDLYTITPPAGVTDSRPSMLPWGAADGQVAGEGAGTVDIFHAILWNSSGVPADLHPVGAVRSSLDSTNGIQQVGSAQFGSYLHATLWSGTAASAIDLNPAGYDRSEAIGVGGNQQVGEAGKVGPPAFTHAFLWTGTAGSGIDLNPAGATTSYGVGTDGVHQAGFASSDTRPDHAIMWSGTAASAIDLSPTNLPGFDSTYALAVRGAVQVGWGANGENDALLWRGTPDSAVDLNPSQLGSSNSYAWATNGIQEVGEMYPLDGLKHAVVWSGTAGSAVDLKQFLPADWKNSAAYSIDAAGNIFGLAADATGHEHAVEWQVPEPSVAMMLPLLLLLRGTGRKCGNRSLDPFAPVGCGA